MKFLLHVRSLARPWRHVQLCSKGTVRKLHKEAHFQVFDLVHSRTYDVSTCSWQKLRQQVGFKIPATKVAGKEIKEVLNINCKSTQFILNNFDIRVLIITRYLYSLWTMLRGTQWSEMSTHLYLGLFVLWPTQKLCRFDISSWWVGVGMISEGVCNLLRESK